MYIVEVGEYDCLGTLANKLALYEEMRIKDMDYFDGHDLSLLKTHFSCTMRVKLF